ncbi:MAG: ABC transporter substrate-binding protein [Bacteroidia bacterium]|nr:ABC transporter substrate-binding protein [Bacteroidia bacterium]
MVSKDQVGRSVKSPVNPVRIISTVPSISELLYDLGLNDRLVGVTKFCVNPSDLLRTKAIVGGTKNLNFDKIHSLKPDLIIANKEENIKEQILELEKHYPVWISDVDGLDTAIEMINQIGTITSKEEKAEKINDEIKLEFNKLSEYLRTNNMGTKKAIYIIWNDPCMLAGNDTFIHELMKKCNFNNAIAKGRYPEFSESELSKLNPDYVLLSSEPFPFKDKHQSKFESMFPNPIVKLVDGEMFSWYGSHIIKAPEYFISLLNELNNKNHS